MYRGRAHVGFRCDPCLLGLTQNMLTSWVQRPEHMLTCLVIMVLLGRLRVMAHRPALRTAFHRPDGWPAKAQEPAEHTACATSGDSHVTVPTILATQSGANRQPDLPWDAKDCNPGQLCLWGGGLEQRVTRKHMQSLVSCLRLATHILKVQLSKPIDYGIDSNKVQHRLDGVRPCTRHRCSQTRHGIHLSHRSTCSTHASGGQSAQEAFSGKPLER